MKNCCCKFSLGTYCSRNICNAGTTILHNTVCTLTCSRYTTSDSNLIELSCCARTLIKDTVTFVCASLDTSCRRDCNRSTARTSIIGINAVSSTARRFTRCCDAQGAGAVFCAKMPFLPPVVVAALIVRSVPCGVMYRCA